MERYATTGLKQDINKFIETQTHIPFTMRNIYRMLDIIIATQGQQVDRAILEVFDRFTEYHDDNKFHVEGWKSNSHYLLSKKFVVPWIVDCDKRWSWTQEKVCPQSSGNFDKVEDLQKALCYVSGKSYDNCQSLWSYLRDNRLEFGEWYPWGFFEVRGYKKGTMHFRFKDENLWARFNQHVAKLKGYPLFEARRMEEPAPKSKPAPAPAQSGEHKTLFTITIKSKQ